MRVRCCRAVAADVATSGCAALAEATPHARPFYFISILCIRVCPFPAPLFRGGTAYGQFTFLSWLGSRSCRTVSCDAVRGGVRSRTPNPTCIGMYIAYRSCSQHATSRGHAGSSACKKHTRICMVAEQRSNSVRCSCGLALFRPSPSQHSPWMVPAVLQLPWHRRPRGRPFSGPASTTI